jgi:hypothetical protein
LKPSTVDERMELQKGDFQQTAHATFGKHQLQVEPQLQKPARVDETAEL